MNNILVSIIVPVYKVPEQYLRQCIESSISQTMREIEIILVDDGSPDDCGKICDEYAERDARIRVIHKENGGLVSARNAGFDAIQGEWHMYIDGDDWIDLDTCESIFKVLNKYKDIDVVFWKCIQELGDKSIKGKWEWPCQDDEHVYSGDECAELARNVLVYKSGIATAYCKLIRTEYAKKNGIRHDDRLKQGMEGTEFSLRTFYYAKHVLYINAYWNHYLFNPMSISKLGSEYNAKCITDCVKVMEGDIASFRNKDVFEQTLYQRVVYALIATGLSTYFHPSSKENLWSRTRKYAKYIKNYPFYTKSIQKCSTEGMDKQRRVVLLLLRFKLYFLLQIVSNVKAYYLKKGKFDY